MSIGKFDIKSGALFWMLLCLHAGSRLTFGILYINLPSLENLRRDICQDFDNKRIEARRRRLIR